MTMFELSIVARMIERDSFLMTVYLQKSEEMSGEQALRFVHDNLISKSIQLSTYYDLLRREIIE